MPLAGGTPSSPDPQGTRGDLRGHRRRLAFPLDYPNLAAAREAAAAVQESAGVLKVGLELFVKEGPAAAAVGAPFDCDLFLDLKLHDIPNTVDQAVGSAAALGARYLTIHASGGPAMVSAAVRRAERESAMLSILAVTVLTSMDAADLRAVGVSAAPEDQVLTLAQSAWDAGARGFVCSVAELAPLRARFGSDALLVTPGIRPGGAEAGDQKRVATPRRAVELGADLLVVGRPIRDAADPRAAARAVLAEIAEATGVRAGR